MHDKRAPWERNGLGLLILTDQSIKTVPTASISTGLATEEPAPFVQTQCLPLTRTPDDLREPLLLVCIESRYNIKAQPPASPE